MVGVSLKPPTMIKHGRSSAASCCEAHGCLSKMSTSWYPRIVSLSPQWVPLLVERRSFEAPFFSLVWMAKLTGTKFVNPVFDSNIWNGLFHVRSFVRDTSAWVDSDLPGLCEPNLEIYNHPRRKGFSIASLDSQQARQQVPCLGEWLELGKAPFISDVVWRSSQLTWFITVLEMAHKWFMVNTSIII